MPMTPVGLDVAPQVLQRHGVETHGHGVRPTRLSRATVLPCMAP